MIDIITTLKMGGDGLRKMGLNQFEVVGRIGSVAVSNLK
jgi:hypothetical protein